VRDCFRKQTGLFSSLCSKTALGVVLQRQPAAFILVLLFGIWKFFRTGLIPSLRYGIGLWGWLYKESRQMGNAIWDLEFFRTGLIPSLRYGIGLGGGFTKKTSTAQQCVFFYGF
jgi:hypothetical protein